MGPDPHPAPAGGTAPPTGEPSGGGLQRINLRIFLDAPPGFDADFLLSVFGRWRLEKEEEIVDLADYAHVEEGPSCLLISHRWHFGIDFSGGRPGLFYSSRKGLKGTASDRIAEAFLGLLEKSRRLLAEPEYPLSVKPLAGEIEVVFNDRLLAPNTDESDALLGPEVRAFAERLYGPGGAAVEREGDPGRRLGYRIRSLSPGGSLKDLARRLAGETA